MFTALHDADLSLVTSKSLVPVAASNQRGFDKRTDGTWQHSYCECLADVSCMTQGNSTERPQTPTPSASSRMQSTCVKEQESPIACDTEANMAHHCIHRMVEVHTRLTTIAKHRGRLLLQILNPSTLCLTHHPKPKHKTPLAEHGSRTQGLATER